MRARTPSTALWRATVALAGLAALHGTPALAADAGRGKLLYPGACASCHGADPTRNRDSVLNGANRPSTIQSAINRNKGGMGVLSGLSTVDVADIAAYLGNPSVATPAPAPAPAPAPGAAPSAANGQALYSTGCVACHGSDPTRNVSRVLNGANNASAISAAIASNLGGMGGLQGRYTTAELNDLAAYLANPGVSSPSPAPSPSPSPAPALSPSPSPAPAPAPAPAANGVDAWTGKSLYASACAVCHGADPTQNRSKILNGSNQPTVIQSAIDRAVGGMDSLQGAFTSTQIASIAAYLANPGVSGPTQVAAASLPTLAPSSIDFGRVAVGGSGVVRSVELSNDTAAAVSVAIAVSGSGFTETHTCGSSLAVGATCRIDVRFTPTATAAATGSLTVTPGSGGPVSAAISGQGSATAVPLLQWTPDVASVHFPSTLVGNSATPQTLTLTNAGPGSATLGAIAMTDTSTAAFGIGASTRCVQGQTLAQGASCTVDVTFQPQAAGAQTATLSATSTNGTNPQALALDGVGTSAGSQVSNVGAGGCSLGDTDEPLDPIWAVLTGLSAALIWRRRRDRLRGGHAVVPSRLKPSPSDPQE